MISHARIDPAAAWVPRCCHVRHLPTARSEDRPYREFIEKVPDTQLAEGLAKMIEEAEAEKAALHRKPQK